MITRHELNNLTWVDLTSPTQEEIRQIMDEYHVPAMLGEELLLPTLRPKVERVDGLIYMVLHFPLLRHTHEVEQNQEVDFIIGKDVLITTRYDTIDPMHKFSKVFEVNSILNRGAMGHEHVGYILFFMLLKLYGSILHELEYISDELDAVEDRIFQGDERAMVVALSHHSRDLLNIKQALRDHKDMLESFREASVEFFGPAYGTYARKIIAEYFRMYHTLRANIETLAELRETNNSLLTTKQNEVMKIFTIMAFVTFPLSLLAAIFGMNTTYLPIIGHPGDFWIIMSIMFIATLAFFVFFKYKKWL